MNYSGETKLAGEKAVQQAGVPHAILRTEWLYATRGKNFLLTMLRLAREGKPLRVVADQIGAPTWARMLAEASSLVVGRFLAANEAETKDLSGVYHATATGETTWHGFTEAILTASVIVLKPANDNHFKSGQRANRALSSLAEGGRNLAE